jgi:hypothetical protein
MSLPRVPLDSSNERQHRTVIATTVNELVKTRPPFDRTKEEVTAGVTPVDYGYPPMDARRYGLSSSSSAALNTSAIQDAINVAEQANGVARLPEGSFNFSGGIDLKDNAPVIGAGPFSTVLTCTTSGVNGFEASSALSGVILEGFRLLGTGVSNANENGIDIVGDSSGGFPKLVLRNLLVSEWGNVGIYLENCFDAAVENCNSSSNISHGFHLISCFSTSCQKNVAYNNDGHGFLIQSAAGQLFTGTAQENALNGLRAETAQGCTFAMYVEQNGHSGSGTTTAQVLLTQRSGGFAVSSGNKVNLFALGGKGSTSPTLESGYGAYFDFAENNEAGGTYGGHLTADIIFTSNSSGNVYGTTEHLSGLSGGDSPTLITDNGTNNIVPAKVNDVQVPASGTGNVGAGEDDLFSFSLPALSLFRDEQSIEIIAWGTTANNANTKRLRLKFGATTIIDTGAVASTNLDWQLRGVVTRRGATVQYAIVTGVYNAAAIVDFTAPGETLTGAVTIKCTGEATADNDIVQRGMIVRGLN